MAHDNLRTLLHRDVLNEKIIPRPDFLKVLTFIVFGSYERIMPAAKRA